MISFVWCWFNSNSVAVQAISSMLSVIVGTVTIAVLCFTWSAIRRQAAAAEAQTAASEALIGAARQQTKATVEAAAAAQEQSRFLALQYEQSMAPLIVAKRTLGGPNMQFGMLQLTNVGAGTAFRVIVIVEKVDLEAIDKSYGVAEFSPSTLGPGDGGETIWRPDAEGFMTVRYQGSDRIDRFTIISTQGGFFQEHWVRSGTQFICL